MEKRAVHEVLARPLAQELLQSPIVHLAYVAPDGYPRVIPTGFLWKDGTFVTCTAYNAPKVRDLQLNPKVALTIDTLTQPPRILLVRGMASVEIVDGIPDEYLQASRKGMPQEQLPAFEQEVRRLYPRMARISITPEWAKLIDFETTLPQAVEELMAQRR